MLSVFLLHLVVSGNRSTWGTPISRTLGKWCLFYQLQILHRACKEWEVRYLIRGKLAANWPGGRWLWWAICGHVGQMQWCPWYALSWRYLWSSSLGPEKTPLIESPEWAEDCWGHNCIHFCSELALALGVSPVPVRAQRKHSLILAYVFWKSVQAWVRNLHETGAPSSSWETVWAFERSALLCEASLGQYDACFSNFFWISSLIPTSQSICRCWCFPAPMATVFYPFDSFRRQPKSHWLRLWCSWLKAGASWFSFFCPLVPMAYANLFWMIA